MFTGIIKHTGRFMSYRSGKSEAVIEVPEPLRESHLGESLAVNGVCLSVEKKSGKNLHFHLSRETLDKSNLGKLRYGASLNLERPLTLSQPLSGHLVTGHIDGTGKILDIRARGAGKRLSVSFPRELQPHFIPKGSVAVNGVSLTIAALNQERFETEIIPLTWKDTNLSFLRRAEEVNLECDIIGKYVYNWTVKK
ncbi:MAG: riboflavin synthase [Candidatus Aminicenantaceae bacterium]